MGNNRSDRTIDRVSRWVRPAVQGMSAYHVPSSEGMVKLDAMENPYGLPESLKAEWLATLKDAEINRYPDPQADSLRDQLRKAFDIPERYGLILGNGSDEIIQMLALVMGGEGRSFFSPEPSFVMYRMIAAMNGLGYDSVDLSADDFSLHVDATVDAIKAKQPAVVFIANPNNPTGNVHSVDDLRKIAEACPGLLIIDEAYAPFTDVTAESLLDDFSHVLIMRTVSKMGLAGLRLGYLFGDAKWVDMLDRVRLPYNINRLTQVTAEFALKHKAVFDEQAQQIRKDRESLYQSLSEMDGIQVWPSEANFILFRTLNKPVNEVFEQLKQQHVLIKCLHGANPLLEDCLRVTVGNDEEGLSFIKAIS